MQMSLLQVEIRMLISTCSKLKFACEVFSTRRKLAANCLQQACRKLWLAANLPLTFRFQLAANSFACEIFNSPQTYR
jgi:hypothetical protein